MIKSGSTSTLGTLETLLTTQAGYLDGLEGLLGGATPAGENHIGEVGGNSKIIDVTFSLDTSAYASGDVLADTQILAACMRADDETGVLHSLTLVDKDDQGVAMKVLIFDANVSLGTENSAPSISDANAASIIGIIDIVAGDWVDLGGVRVCNLRNLGIVIQPATGTDDVYVALLNGTGTPTFTASGIVGRFGFLRD